MQTFKIHQSAFLLTERQIEWAEKAKVADTDFMTPKEYGPKATSTPSAASSTTFNEVVKEEDFIIYD